MIEKVDRKIFELNELESGKDIASHFAIEEMSELTKELIKDMRGIGVRENIIEELSHVYYTMCLLQYKYDITDEDINRHILEKQNIVYNYFKGDVK